MPVILSDETWTRIQNMLDDYESGVLRVIPGKGLRVQEQRTTDAHCPGTLLTIDEKDPGAFGFGTLNLNVCISGQGQYKTFLTKL